MMAESHRRKPEDRGKAKKPKRTRQEKWIAIVAVFIVLLMIGSALVVLTLSS
jgi:hypothetical protein